LGVTRSRTLSVDPLKRRWIAAFTIWSLRCRASLDQLGGDAIGLGSDLPAPLFDDLLEFLRWHARRAARGEPMSRLEAFAEPGGICVRPSKGSGFATALGHVFGYKRFNDGSIRDIQFKHSIAAGMNFHATGGFAVNSNAAPSSREIKCRHTVYTEQQDQQWWRQRSGADAGHSNERPDAKSREGIKRDG
jgi:hypothetical protein